LFLILGMHLPFDGLIAISSEPLQAVITVLTH
jgi:hypothetical protein